MISDIRISTIDQHLEYLDQVADWITEEWSMPRAYVLATLLDNMSCPKTLIAISPTGPTGTLGFKIYALKPRGVSELWLDALYVAAPFRGQGLGKQLVREGIKAAEPFNRESIFVYTDIPEFYEPLGWHRFSYDATNRMHVLEFVFQADSDLA